MRGAPFSPFQGREVLGFSLIFPRLVEKFMNDCACACKQKAEFVEILEEELPVIISSW